MNEIFTKAFSDLVLVIPAFNESYTIGEVVSSCKKIADVIVVDDGSSDSTSEIASNMGATVIRHVKNLGYESAIETGLRTGLQSGYLYAITLDGDGQHPIEYINGVYKKLISGDEIVCGARNCKQRIMEDIFGLYGQLTYGIKDPLCGLKGYQLSMEELRNPFNTFKSVGTEILFKVAIRGGKIGNFRIQTQPRKDLSRFGGGLIANANIFKALIYILALKISCCKLKF